MKKIKKRLTEQVKKSTKTKTGILLNRNGKPVTDIHGHYRKV